MVDAQTLEKACLGMASEPIPSTAVSHSEMRSLAVLGKFDAHFAMISSVVIEQVAGSVPSISSTEGGPTILQTGLLEIIFKKCSFFANPTVFQYSSCCSGDLV